MMWQIVVAKASRLFGEVNRNLRRPRGFTAPLRQPTPGSPPSYLPLESVSLTDGVGHTLFEEYAAHRKEARGDEETGWVLLGLREARHAVVLATLPAGALRDASASHVLFNSTAQALASRIVRQSNRQLNMLGVVHTHPGSLRHPSDGDFRGDSQWVRVLRNQEGIFGIGTADGRPNDTLFAEQPRPHVQTLGELCFSWYTLRQGDTRYRLLPVNVTIGPDLGRPLHRIWSSIETHAERLDRLFRQQAGIKFAVGEAPDGPGLEVTVPLAEPGDALRAFLTEKEVRYFLLRGGQMFAVDVAETRVDRGIYLLFAELAAHD